MRVPRHYTPITLLVIVTLFLQPMLQTLSLTQMAPAWLHSFAAPVARAQSDGQVYLPIVSGTGSLTPISTATATPTATPTQTTTPTATPTTTSGSPPSFVIMAPTAGSTVAGTINFAIQPLNAISITSVSFQTGNTQLGVDNTPSDGFRVFVNTKNLAAGNQQFTATATGPSGNATQSVTVNVVPNPPSNATIGASGGVLASQTGSVISILPGSVPDGTAITVTEMTQQEVTDQNGIQWDQIGVTFLGQQNIQSSAPFSLPLGSVTSAGYGNRVQPGQAVVNYRIAPDMDGDGVDEIVVVNTASVAPNGDVIADPVTQPAFLPSSVNFGLTSSKSIQEISLSPGSVLAIGVTGFNHASAMGNIAIYRSMVDSKEVRIPVIVTTGIITGVDQVIFTQIPHLATGAATLSLLNSSTGSISGPIDLIVEAATPLQKPDQETIGEALGDAQNWFESRAQEFGDDTFEKQVAEKAINSIAQFRQLILQEENEELSKFSEDLAVMLENSRSTDSVGGDEYFVPLLPISILSALSVQEEVKIASLSAFPYAAFYAVAALLAASGEFLSGAADWLGALTEACKAGLIP